MPGFLERMVMMKRRFAPLLLALALVLGLAAPAGAAGIRPVDVTDPSLVLPVTAGQAAAEKLNAMGLFQGVGTNADGTPDFDLARTPTRVEGVTLLVRLLGQEYQGSHGGWKSPFTDVPGWAVSYVGYAYHQGYTKGTSETVFGSMLPMDAAQYLTLVLRAMGYEDGEDFQWDSPWTLSNALGITDYDPANPGTFTRGTAAVWAWNALGAMCAGGDGLLVDQLVRNKGITPQQGVDAGLLKNCKGGVALSHNILICNLADNIIPALWLCGLPEDAPDPELTWTSSNPEVATVSPHSQSMWMENEHLIGNIHKVSCGTTVITATSADGAMSASATVTVIDTNSYLELYDGSGEPVYRSYEMWAEDPAEFTAKVMPEHTAADKNITWELKEYTDNGPAPAPASAAELEVVDADPEAGTSTVRVTFHRAGEFTLGFQTADTSDSVRLEVNEASPDVIIDCKDTIPAGEWMSVQVEEVKDYTPSLRVRLWENSNPEVGHLAATTNDSSGRSAGFDALKPGTTTITATLTDGTVVSKTITVTGALASPVISLPDFPCTLETYGSSGDLVYRLTITDGRYDFDGGLLVWLEGTVDYVSSTATDIMLNFRITDDDTGEVIDENVFVLPGEEGEFEYVPSSYSPDSYEVFRKGHTYTLEFVP